MICLALVALDGDRVLDHAFQHVLERLQELAFPGSIRFARIRRFLRFDGSDNALVRGIGILLGAIEYVFEILLEHLDLRAELVGWTTLQKPLHGTEQLLLC
jgi:hypothetical protein